MKKFYELLFYFFLICALLTILATAFIRFYNPELTETQLFLNFWYMPLIALVFVCISVYSLNKTN